MLLLPVLAWHLQIKRKTLTKVVIKKQLLPNSPFWTTGSVLPSNNKWSFSSYFYSPLFPHPKECWEILALLNIAAMTVIRVTKNVCIFTQFVGYERIFFYPLASVVNWVGDGMDSVQEVPWPLYLHKLRNGSVSVMLMRSTVDLFRLYVLASITRLPA